MHEKVKEHLFHYISHIKKFYCELLPISIATASKNIFINISYKLVMKRSNTRLNFKNTTAFLMCEIHLQKFEKYLSSKK